MLTQNLTNRLLFILSFSLLLFVSCSAQSIEDIIKPIHLKANQVDSVLVSDLFYYPNYNLQFQSSPNLEVKFNRTSKKLYLKSHKFFEGMTLLDFELNGKIYEIPIIVKKQHFYKFSFKPKKKYKELTLFGSFNGWNRHQLFMQDKNGNGIYEVEVPLEPGNYQYKFFGDGKEIVDPNNPVKVPNGFGDFNSVISINDTDSNKIFLHVLGYENSPDTFKYKYDFDTQKGTPALSAKNIFALLNNTPIELNLIKLKSNKIKLIIPKAELSGKNVLRIAVNYKGKVSNIQTTILFNGIPANNKHFTWYDGIIYMLMVDRFDDGDKSIDHPIIHDSLSIKANYMGGDFQGIIDQIDAGYFDSLGVNTLWISPVNDNPNEAFREYPKPHRWFSGYHGYWPISATRVEEEFGTFQKLKEVIKKAHSHNIKVLLDFVSHHVHKEHPFFKNHRDWFGHLKLPDGRLNLRFWDEYRLTTWFEPYLPTFDYIDSKIAQDTMTDNAIWWLKQTGADGFRHDAVKHVPNKFWRELTRKLNKEMEFNKDVNIYQIGETFGSYDLISSYVNNGQLNAQFNFNLYDVALPTFIKPGVSFNGLDKEMHKSFSVYGYNHLMGNIMDSQDKNRFMAFADGDLDVSQWSAVEEGWNNPPKVDHPESYKKLVLYMAYMNTIPGLPVIYYGSEFGMTGASDPDNRRMMRFGKQLSKYEKQTLKEVSKIINLRKTHSALRYGDFYTLKADSTTYAYMRSDMNERLIVLLNKSNVPQRIELVLPEFLDVDYLENINTGRKIPTDRNSAVIVVPAMDWAIYKPE